MEVLKYKIDGDFIENEFYDIEIDSALCVKIISVDNPNISESLLESLHGKTVPMQYKGKSKIDNMSIFIISPTQAFRELKLRSIL